MKKTVEKIWFDPPWIPKCIKLYIVAFAVFMFILILDDQCIISFSCISIWFLLTLYFAHKRKQRINSTYSWKKINALVISKKIQRGSPFGATPLLPYLINIVYEYTHGHNTYRSNTFAVESCMEHSINYIYSKSEANELLSELIKDDNIDIYIDPRDPSDSIIMQGMSATYRSSYFLLLMLFILPCLFFYIKCMLL